MAMAWLSKLVPLSTRTAIPRGGSLLRETLGTKGGTLGGGDVVAIPFVDRNLVDKLLESGLAKRPHSDLPAGTPMGVYDTKRELVGNKASTAYMWVKCATSAECKPG